MITKKEVLENLDEVKKYVSEIDNIAKEESKKFEIKNRWNRIVIYTSSKTTYKDVVEEAVSHGAYLRGAYLRGADLEGADLRGAYLEGADLKDANLEGAYLRGAYLRGADLEGADLRGADLRDAELMHAKFYGKGGSTKIKKNQVDDFFKALGIIVE